MLCAKEVRHSELLKGQEFSGSQTGEETGVGTWQRNWLRTSEHGYTEIQNVHHLSNPYIVCYRRPVYWTTRGED